MPTNLLRKRRNLLRERRAQMEATADAGEGIEGPLDVVKNIGQGINRYAGSVLSGADYALRWGDESIPPGPLGQAGAVLKGERDVPGLPGTRMSRQPESRGEEIFQASGRMIGESVAPGGALIRQGLKAVKPAGNAVQRFAQSFANDAAATAVKRPAATLAGEMVGAGYAGAGGEVGKEVAGENYPMTGQAFGELAGGTVPAITSGLARAGGRAVQFARDIISPSARQSRTEDIIAEHLGPQLRSDPMRANLERAQEVTAKIPGYNPDLAQRAQSEALKETKDQIFRDASGAELEALKARDKSNVQALQDFGANTNPGGRGGSGAEEAFQPLVDRRLADEAELKRLEGARADLAKPHQLRAIEQQELGQLRDETNEARSKLLSGLTRIDPKAKGAEISSGVNAEISRRKRVFDEDMKAAGLNNKLDMKPALQQFDTMLRVIRRQLSPAQREAADKMSSMVTLKNLRGRKTTTFEDIKKFREDLVTDILESGRDMAPGHRTRQRYALQVRDALDSVLHSEDFPALGAETVQRWTQLRRRYFNEIVHPFERSAVKEIRRQDGSGFLRTLDEDVGMTFLRDADAAEQLAGIARTNPSLLKAVEDVAIDDIANNVVSGGVLRPQALESWIARHRTALDQLPNVKSAVNDILGQAKVVENRPVVRGAEIRGRTQRDLAEVSLNQQRLDAAMQPIKDRLSSLVQRQDLLEDTALARRMASAQRVVSRKVKGIADGADPRVAIRRMMRSPDQLKAFMGELRMLGREGKDALRATRRHVWDELRSMSGADLSQYMKQNEKTLKIAFSKGHLENLELLRDGLIMQEFSPAVGRASPIRPDMIAQLRQLTGMDISQIASRYVNVKSGRLSGRVARMDMAFRWIASRNMAAMEQVMRRALFDESIAQSLADSARVSQRGIPTRKLRAWLWNLGLMAPTEEVGREVSSNG